MHFYKPNQIVKIVTLQIAVPAEYDDDEIREGTDSMLTHPVSTKDPFLLDWRFADPKRIVDKTVRVSHVPKECEAFERNPVPDEKTFEVCVLRNCQQHVWVTVKARDQVEAGEKALSKAPNEDFSGTGGDADYEVDEVKEAR